MNLATLSFFRRLAEDDDADDNTATLAPSAGDFHEGNFTAAVLEKAEEEHEYDAVETLLLNLCLICCLMLAYYVKRFRIYSFPESTGALLVGAIIGGGARLYTENLTLFEFVSVCTHRAISKGLGKCCELKLSFPTPVVPSSAHSLFFFLRLNNAIVARSLFLCPASSYYF